ncbi:MAG TPA: ATP-dependent helicase, partial [Myxococcaceae bacterium]|nr:ATP-dependent helicase [Myxococcaceae bacterium]
MSVAELKKSSEPLPSPGPWLQRWLSPQELQETAGITSYARGRELLAGGRVESLRASPEAVQGTVRGRSGMRFQVKVSADAEGLIVLCQCPFFFESGTCEHAVALGLAFLQAQAPEPLPYETTPPSETTPAPEEVPAWLKAHQLDHLRRIPASSAEAFLPKPLATGLHLYLLATRPLTDLLEARLELPSYLAEARTALHQAAWTLAHTEAEHIRKGLEWERNTPCPPPPTDPRLMPLVEALQRARARVRECAVPRLPPGSLQVLIQGSPPVATALERNSRVLPGGRAGEHATDSQVRLELLRLLEDEETGLFCPCSPGESYACCVHTLAALDALCAVLADARHARENARLAEQLFVTPGPHLLAALQKASLESLAGQGSESLLISFRLDGLAHGQEPQLKPYVHRPLKRGGFSRGALLSPFSTREWEQARASLGSPEEAQALELSRMTHWISGKEGRRHLVLQALRLLAHSPRLVLASRPEVPLRLREETLGFAFEENEAEGGALRLRPALEGAPVSPTELVPPPERTSPLPWMYLEPELPRLTLVTVPPKALAVLDVVTSHGTRLPGEARAELLRRLGGVEAAFPVSLPASLEAREVPATPGLLLRLRPAGEALEGALLVQPLPEAPPLVPGEGADTVRAVRGGERVRVQRNLAAERAELDALCEKLALPAPGAHGRFTLEGTEEALGFLERLEPLVGPALRVEWEESKPWKVVHSPEARGLKVEVRQQRDWFGVEGGL